MKVTIRYGNIIVFEAEKEVTIQPRTAIQTEELNITLNDPRLWMGKTDPFMYQASITLTKDNKQLDSIEQPLGLCYYTTDANAGFSLNGKIFT